MRAFGAMPVKGMPCLRRSLAAMMPATTVPWPAQSWLPPPTRETAVTRPASCRLKSTPLSTTATVTPLPCASGHTLGAASARCAHGCLVTLVTGAGAAGAQFRVGRMARVTGTGTSGPGPAG